jgi:hypothetical protein
MEVVPPGIKPKKDVSANGTDGRYCKTLSVLMAFSPPADIRQAV